MPAYTWLFTKKIDFDSIPLRMRTVNALHRGKAYSDEEIADWERITNEQAQAIADEIVDGDGEPGLQDKQVVALIAYLQRLGTDLNKQVPVEESVDEAADEGQPSGSMTESSNPVGGD